MREKGRVIAFLGPDGSGKSTLIDGLKKELDERNINYRYFHWRIPWKKRKSKSGPANVVVDPHGKPIYPITKACIKLIWLFCMSWPAWFRHARPALNKGDWVILDRGIWDIIPDNKRYRLPRWEKFYLFMVKLFPKAETMYILHCNAQIIYDRKQEVSFHELQRQCQAYHDLSQHMGTLVDVSKSPEDICNHHYPALFSEQQDFSQ
ncbi:MAG: hypothetical protein HQL32_11840 [Planctomycetes bacterium]|nr:hypothetical protein [Planctomycetota bacterium]